MADSMPTKTQKSDQSDGAAQQPEDAGSGGSDLRQRALLRRARDRKQAPDAKHTKAAGDEKQAHAQPKVKLEDLEADDFSDFFNAVDYYDQSWNDRPVKVDHEASPTLNWLSESLAEVVSLIWEDKPASLAKARSRWPALRDTIDSLRPRAEKAHTPPGDWIKAVKALDNIEELLVDEYVDKTLDERAAGMDSHAPGEEMAKATFKIAPKAAASTLELLKQANSALGTAKNVAGDDVSAATKGLGTSIDSVTFLFETVSEGREIHEALERFRNAGVVEKTATLFDLSHYIANTLKGAAEIAQGAIKTIAYKSLGPKVAEEILEGSALFNKLEGYTDALGTVAAIFGIASSAVKVIDAIKKGDARAAIEAGMDVAAGGVGLAATLLDLGGAGPGMAAGIYVFAWKGLIDGVAQMEGTLKALKQEHKQRSLGRVLEQAQGAAKSGVSMAAAAELAEKESAAKRGSLDEKVHDKFDDKQYALAKDTVQWLRFLRGHIGIGEDKPDYPGYYPDLRSAFGPEAERALQSLDGPGLDGDMPYVPLVTQLATAIFAGMDKMVARIMSEDEYGDVKKKDDDD
jgi:hypothetical protein